MMQNKGCITCKKCEQVRLNFYCGRKKLSQKQLYNKYGFCTRYEPVEQKPQTNEEWFASLSTKEKAKWMFELTYKCYWCGREYAKTKKFNEKECPFHKCLDNSKGFEKWLKTTWR